MKYIFTCIWIIISLPLLFSQNSFLKYYDFKSEYGNIHALCRVGDELMGTGIFWDTFIAPNKLNIVAYKSDLNGDSFKYSYYRDVDSSAYTRIIIGPLYFQNILFLDDSTYVFCFYNMKKNYLEIFKFDNDFNVLNTNKIIAYNNNNSVFPSKMLLLNGDIYLSGFEKISTNIYRSHLFKFNQDLNLISKKEIPGIERVRSFGYNILDNEFTFSEFDKGDEYVITDTLLNTKKTKKLADGLSDVYHENLKTTKDGKSLTSSYNLNGSPNFTLNIVKRDEEFDMVWKFGMGGIPGDRATVVNIIPSSDNAYFAYGQVGARVVDIRDIYSSLDSIDIKILSTVKFRDDGKILWQRFDTLETGYYNLSYAECGGMIAADDGGIYTSGKITCYDTIRVNDELKRIIQYKYFLMKIDSNGCVEGLHCNVEPKTETILSVQPSLPTDAGKMTVYPNPTTGIVTVDMGMTRVAGQLTVYNVLGEVVATRSLAGDEKGVQLDLSGQPSGQYYITIRRDDGKMAKASFIIHR
jgi:hypothetical protein